MGKAPVHNLNRGPIVVGDGNRDGAEDIVVGSSGVAVLLGQGNGRFNGHRA